MSYNNFKLLKNDDPTALARIHALYSKRLFWVGKGLIRDEFVIESIAQDTFLKLWLNRGAIESPEHIYFFLRYVMKRECISYYCRPRNKFSRNIYSLENFENYSDYMVSYDPVIDNDHLRLQDSQQRGFDNIMSVLPLLTAKRRLLINLCLKYEFKYKAISKVMGTNTSDTYHEVKKAIQDIKTIIHSGRMEQNTDKSEGQISTIPQVMSKNQEMVLKLRFNEKHSFKIIAETMNISQKKVHKEFMIAFKIMKEQQMQQMQQA